MNPTDAMVKNKFVDKMLSIIPEDPVSQTQYLYYLTSIVFLGFVGFTTATWYNVFMHFNFMSLFQGIFMGAISMLSLFGLKQARGAYMTMKSLGLTKTTDKSKPAEPLPKMEVESVDDMMKEFEE